MNKVSYGLKLNISFNSPPLVSVWVKGHERTERSPIRFVLFSVENDSRCFLHVKNPGIWTLWRPLPGPLEIQDLLDLQVLDCISADGPAPALFTGVVLRLQTSCRPFGAGRVRTGVRPPHRLRPLTSDLQRRIGPGLHLEVPGTGSPGSDPDRTAAPGRGGGAYLSDRAVLPSDWRMKVWFPLAVCST